MPGQTNWQACLPESEAGAGRERIVQREAAERQAAEAEEAEETGLNGGAVTKSE